MVINGEEGYWMTGPHLVMFDDGNFSETTRSNGNVLIWSAGGITYRLETALTLPEARELAQNLELMAPRV